MDSTATLARIASLVSRNLVPVAGVLLLGWSVPDLLVLCYLDTVLGFAVVVLLVARHLTGLGAPGERGRPRAQRTDASRPIATFSPAATTSTCSSTAPRSWSAAGWSSWSWR